MRYAEYSVESVCGEIPVDVTFHPFGMGRVRPYLTSGLSYGYDFAALHGDERAIHRFNSHDLRFTCGLGLDCDTRYIKIGIELKAGFGLLSPFLILPPPANPFYIQGSPDFCLGIDFEA